MRGPARNITWGGFLARSNELLAPSQEYFQPKNLPELGIQPRNPPERRIQARNNPRSDARHGNQKITMGFPHRMRFPARVVQSYSDSSSSLTSHSRPSPRRCRHFLSTTPPLCVSPAFDHRLMCHLSLILPTPPQYAILFIPHCCHYQWRHCCLLEVSLWNLTQQYKDAIETQKRRNQ